MSKDNFKEKEKKIWSLVQDGGLTIGRKITEITLTFDRL
jgi:hypothetical protein